MEETLVNWNAYIITAICILPIAGFVIFMAYNGWEFEWVDWECLAPSVLLGLIASVLWPLTIFLSFVGGIIVGMVMIIKFCMHRTRK